jgi:hypothetical protein
MFFFEPNSKKMYVLGFLSPRVSVYYPSPNFSSYEKYMDFIHSYDVLESDLEGKNFTQKSDKIPQTCDKCVVLDEVDGKIYSFGAHDHFGRNSVYEYSTIARYPVNVKIDAGNDGTTDWSMKGLITEPIIVDLSAGSINEALSVCTGDYWGNCLIPIVVSSDSLGSLRISRLKINTQRQEAGPITITTTPTTVLTPKPTIMPTATVTPTATPTPTPTSTPSQPAFSSFLVLTTLLILAYLIRRKRVTR